MTKQFIFWATLVVLFMAAEIKFAQSFPELVVQTGHSNAVTSFAFSPDEKILASVGNDGKIKLWDLERDIELRTLDGDSDLVSTIFFSPDGKSLASAGRGGKINLWDIDSGRVFKTLQQEGAVYCLAFSPDGRLIAAGDENNVISVWRTDADSKAVELYSEHFVRNLSFNPEGTILYGGSRAGLTRWNLKTEKLIKTFTQFTGDSKTIAVSGNGRILANVLFGDTSNIALNSIESRRGAANDARLRNARFIPGKRRAEGEFPVELWDIEKEKLLCTLPGHDETVLSVLFSPDGKTLATGGADNVIKLWDVAGCTEKKSFEQSDSVYSISFSPGGKLLVGGSGDNLIKLWDIESGDVLKLLSRPSKIITASLRADGKFLAIAAWDKTLSFLDLQTGKASLVIRLESQAMRIAFSPDGKTLAIKTIYGELSQLDIESKKETKIEQLPDWFETSVNQNNVSIEQGSKRMRLSDREKKPLGEFLVFQPDDWIIHDSERLFYGSELGQTRLLWRFTENLYDIAPVEAFYFEYYYPGLEKTLTAGEKPKVLTEPKPFEKKDIRQSGVFLCRKCPCSPEVRFSVREETVVRSESNVCVDIIASPDFAGSDFIDFNGMAKRLVNGTDAASRKIFSAFLAGNIINNQRTLQDYVRTLDANPAQPPDLSVVQLMQREFNAFLRRKDFYKDFSASVVNISPATRALSLTAPKGNELAWLNRMLLEDIFRTAIKPGKISGLENPAAEQSPAPEIKGVCSAGESCLQDLRLFWNGRLVQRWRGDITKSCTVVNRYRVQCQATVPVVKGIGNYFKAYLFNQDRVKSKDGELILN